MFSKDGPTRTCACCGQTITAVHRPTLMVDETVLDACNRAFERAQRDQLDEVEIAHVIVCLVSSVGEHDFSSRYASSRRHVIDAAERWIHIHAKCSRGLLRTSPELKWLLERAQDAARRQHRPYASAWDVFEVLRWPSADLTTGQFFSEALTGHGRDSRDRGIDRSQAQSRTADHTSSNAYGQARDAARERGERDIGLRERVARESGSHTPFASFPRSGAGYGRAEADTWTTPSQAFRGSEHLGAGQDQSSARTLDPRDRALQSLAEKLQEHEKLLTALLERERPFTPSRQRAASGESQSRSRTFSSGDWSSHAGDAGPSADGRASNLASAEKTGIYRRRRRLRWRNGRKGRESWTGSAFGSLQLQGDAPPAEHSAISAGKTGPEADLGDEADFGSDLPAESWDADDPADAGESRAKRFYLSMDDPVVHAPSIGNRTAAKLEAVGIRTVRDLLNENAERVVARINSRYITVERFSDWQAQARLVCVVPWLRGTHAQLFVGAGYKSLDQIVGTDVASLCAAMLRFASTRDGRSVIRSGPPPDIERITKWVANASLAEVERAA